MVMMHPVKIIGVGDDGANGLFPTYRQWIEEADTLVGGERHLAFFLRVPPIEFRSKTGSIKCWNGSTGRDITDGSSCWRPAIRCFTGLPG